MAEIIVSGPGRATTGNDPYTDPRAREHQGLYAIHEPTLNGFDHLLFLDKNWLIIASNTNSELFTEIDNLSSGALETQYDAWAASVKAGSPDTGDRNDMWDTRDTYMWQARKSVEAPLGTTAAFSISSSDDSNYLTPAAPTNADKVQVSYNDDALRPSLKNVGWTDLDWHIYSYLEMPTSLVEGKTYTITFSNSTHPNDGYSVTFLFDLDRTISRAIKVNQVGYLPSATVKKAYLGCHLYTYAELDLSHTTTFEVVNTATQAVGYSGSVTLVEAAPVFDADPSANAAKQLPMYGEDVYEMDFSSMTDTGEFFIRVPGVGRSWPFYHKSSAYSEAAYTSFRGLYHQRMGQSKSSEYTDWARRKAKLGPLYYESENFNRPRHLNQITDYERFDVIGGTTNRGISTPEVEGGYYDAADFDGKLVHLTATIDLLYAYEWNASAFSDDQFDIPESGNGIPDILSEARYGLELWRASQDVNGGVSGQLETWTHAKIDSELPSGIGPPGATKTDYSFSTRTRWHSGIYAAIAAHYAQLVAPFDASDAADYQASAILAYNYCKDPANSVGTDFVINAVTDRGTGDPYTFLWTENEEDKDVYLMWAKLRLFLLTSDSAYITDSPTIASLAATSKIPYQSRFSRKDYSQWIYYSIIEADDAGAPGLSTLATTWRQWFIDDADDLVTDQTTGSTGSPLPAPYKQFMAREVSNGIAWAVKAPFNMSRSLWIAQQLTTGATAQAYKDRMIEATDNHFGCNAMGMSWVSGIGYVYPVKFQSETSTQDGIDDPVPGIPIYGITSAGVYGAFLNRCWEGFSDGWARSNYQISSLTQTGGTAAAVTANPLLTFLEDGDKVSIRDANESEYNIEAAITVTGANTFTFPIDSGAPATATGAPIYKAWFPNSASEENPPMWRRWYMNPVDNVSQNEYTINETMAGNIFNTLMLLDSFETVTRPKARKPKDVYGKWYLV